MRKLTYVHINMYECMITFASAEFKVSNRDHMENGQICTLKLFGHSWPFDFIAEKIAEYFHKCLEMAKVGLKMANS